MYTTRASTVLETSHVREGPGHGRSGPARRTLARVISVEFESSLSGPLLQLTPGPTSDNTLEKRTYFPPSCRTESVARLGEGGPKLLRAHACHQAEAEAYKKHDWVEKGGGRKLQVCTYLPLMDKYTDDKL